MSIIIDDIKQWSGSVEKGCSVLSDYARYSHPVIDKENVAGSDTQMLCVNDVFQHIEQMLHL